MGTGTSFARIAPLFILLLALCIPIVAIIMGALTRMRRAELTHETVRQLVAKGQEIPPQLFDGSLFSDRPTNANWNKSRQLMLGASNVAAGLGLMVMFYFMSPGKWLWAIGCIPLFIGIAMLLVWKLDPTTKP